MTEMFSILEIEAGASKIELEKAYKGKRQRYLMEIKSTSAKSRIRLLEAKLAKLETAYREYAVKASIPKLKENPKVCSANETNEGSGEAMGSKGLPSPDSFSERRLYPIIAAEGKLINEEIRRQMSFYINGDRQSIQEDGSLLLGEGVNEIRAEHPEFRTFEHSFHARNLGTSTLTIELVPKKYKFNLTILPKVNFRIFVDGWEHPRSLTDFYEFPIFNTKRLTIKADGFEDAFLEIEESINNQDISLTLVPSLESCDLLQSTTPFLAKNIATNEEAKFFTSDSFIFGRGTTATIHLSEDIENNKNHEDLFISREHFSIVKKAKKVFLKDLSSNGTYLNGKKITDCQELTSGMNHKIEIYNPHKEKALVRKVIMVHADTHPLFVSVKTLFPNSADLTHILLFPECALMRNSAEEQTKWLRIILQLISEHNDMKSPSCLQNEVKLWKTIHKN